MTYTATQSLKVQVEISHTKGYPAGHESLEQLEDWLHTRLNDSADKTVKVLMLASGPLIKPTATAFDPMQQFVLEHYPDNVVQCPADVPECGDGLLKFLLTECSGPEDCYDHQTMVTRINTAINDLIKVRDAAEAALLTS